MDHSPSEQLTGEEWHTTAIIISHAVEHHDLAICLAKEMNIRNETLRKWSKSTQKYRDQFGSIFFEQLSRHPVMVLGFSATESSIRNAEPHFVQALGIQNHYCKHRDQKKERVTVGPFTRNDSEETETITLSSKQAPMALFIAHNLIEANRCMQGVFSIRHRQCKQDAPWIWWQVFSDRPPNNFDGPMSNFLSLLLSANDAQGRFTWGGFIDREDVEVDLLADNVAGFINQCVQNNDWPTSNNEQVTQPPLFCCQVLSCP